LNQKWYIAKNKRLRVDVYRAEDGGLKTKFMDETGNQTYYYTQKSGEKPRAYTNGWKTGSASSMEKTLMKHPLRNSIIFF
jgi:hypothetical protein